MGAAVFFAAALAACGGGGGTPPPNGGGTPTPTPVPSGSTVTANSTSPTTAPLPPVRGYSGTFDVPSGSGSATIYDSLSNYSGTPVLQVVHSRKRARVTPDASSNTPLLYLEVVVPSPGLNLNGSPGFVFNVPSGVTGNVLLAQLVSGVWTTMFGPVAITSGTATFPSQSGAISIPAGTYYFALYQGGIVPTAGPTSNPFGCVGSSPFAVSRRAPASAPNPIASGDTFSYTGALSTTYAQSAPCPQPTATASGSASVSVTDSATTGPNGATSNQHSVENDYLPTQTRTTTTDDSLFATAGGLFLTQSTTSDPTGDSATFAYANAQKLVQYPETSGNTWNNTPAATYTETLSDGTRVKRTINGDGTYTDTETYADGTTATATVNANGSGSYTIPYGGGITFNYGVPSGPPPSGTITLSITPGTTTRTFPAWFTAGTPYISDIFADDGSATIDSSCGSNSAGATTGEKIVETYSDTDPVIGYTENRTTTSYDVAGYGAVCVIISDTLNSFYDYQDDIPKLDYQSQNGQPNSVDSITEHLSMSAPPTPYAQIRRRSAQTRGVSPLAVAQRIAVIEHRREMQRAQREEQMHEIMLNLLQSKGAVQ